MAVADTSDIPHLTDAQHGAVREFVVRHRDETDGRISINPIVLARVVARDKPAADMYLKGEKTHPNFDAPDGYLHRLCDILGLEMRKIKGGRGWVIGRSQWRLDCLPTVLDPSDAYHRRCGFVYGFPTDAIEAFIESSTSIPNCDLVRGGVFPVEDVAYLTFVPYIRRNTLQQVEEQIEQGKQIRRRIGGISDVWDLPELDDYATLHYEDVAAAYQGNATWTPPTLFPPDTSVARDDVLSLFS